MKRKSSGSLEDINSQFKEIKNEAENKEDNKTENAVEPKEDIIKNDISDYDGNDFNDYSR